MEKHLRHAARQLVSATEGIRDPSPKTHVTIPDIPFNHRYGWLPSAEV
jgi:hypothetical protein